MYHYLFTNDLRISTLNESLKRAGYCFMTGSVPSAQENKNDNNNMKTFGFYFNLTETSNCAVACANGDVRKVVLNFIKKFQFPNPRTAESLTDAMNDNILVAPMRVVLQVLYNMQMLYPSAAYLTREEIKDFVFYNSYVAKNKRFNVIELIEQIINYRKTSVYPDSVDKTPINRQWKQEDRQIREMTKILTWSGCVSEDENLRLFIRHDNLTLQNKAALFDILTYNNFWNPKATKNYAENREDYEAYMDVEAIEENIDDSFDDIFNHSVYGIHIKLKNDALSEDNPHVCIGWSGMGDLSDITTKEELSSRYDATWSDVKSRKKGQDIGQVWRFIKEMQVGDYVVFSCGDTCHIGKIASDYYFDNTANENQHPDYTNIRDVEWLKKDIRKSDLSQALQNSLGAAMSVFGLNDYKSAIQELLNDTYQKDDGDIDIEENCNIFEGFALWLTSYDNPDYTGREKYVGYPRALERLVQFMTEKGYIDDDNLNDINLEKFIHIKSVYDNTDEVKEFDERYLASKAGIASLKKYIKYIEYLMTAKPKAEVIAFDYSDIKGKGVNKIFYGVPGCGKSYHIQHKILEKGQYAFENIIRTTFYQDYSNTDFVGQILPKIVKGENGEKDTVEYIFNPGPFTLALIRSISNPNEKVALIVEEINRGNAPAIFGDIFQLLDRDDDGISEYGIKNVGIIDYLSDYEFTVDGEKKHYTFSEIKIPGNMDIFATMNTSDQNVYTVDTAFTRRWSKERMLNDFNGNEIKDMLVPGMYKYTWKEFVDAINSRIQDKLDDLQVNEDKQVGAFFVKKADLLPKDATLDDTEKAKAFAYKVIEYLWDDVSKLDHSVIFNPSYKTFEKLVDGYVKNGVTVFNREIFKEKTEDLTLESSLEE